MGREKIVPALADMAVFLELLPRSATGQKMSSYVSFITGRQRSHALGGSGLGEGAPWRTAPEREFHLVILDKGRSEALADAELREALMCIRCGACLNACAPYTVVGGHVYGGDPYPGGIGCVWTYITKGHAQAWDFGGLCTTCSRCTEVCPVKIDIPWLNTVIRERNNREFGVGLRERMFARADLLGKGLGPVGPLADRALRTPPARSAFRTLGIDASRGLPAYERRTFLDWWKRRPEALRRVASPTGRAALLVDCFVNRNLPQVGRAAVEVLERAGVDVVVAHSACCGRPAMSQGLQGAPRRWAVRNLAELGGLIDQGYEIVCIEPSCLSALRDDYRKLLETTSYARDPRLAGLERHAYEVTEYLVMLERSGSLTLDLSFILRNYVVHGHCHQKSLGIGSTPAELLRLIPGITVHEVEALCCGMVGSFGYNREYAALSRAIGERLFEQIAGHEGDVVACGISCRSQIEAGTGRRVVHPVEVLAAPHSL